LPISAIIFAIAGIVAFVTGSWEVGIGCLVIAAVLFALAFTKRPAS
jgi:hypothetical protein